MKHSIARSLSRGPRRRRQDAPPRAPEAQAEEAVPLLEIDVRGRVTRLDPDDGAVHLGRRAEVVLPDLQEVVDPGEELRVGAEAAVLGVTGLGNLWAGGGGGVKFTRLVAQLTYQGIVLA